ncbi:DUF3800 domain-containing protein [Afipia massiliensis]|uniref:DUF3800 domain-containing protein n=1 Tax=Afipia massiliensis TaxID=211460 RepID=A0A4U6BLY9_9BRAD|nr:DUF3800 domain-containing protein [Afipia massiliensis]TKT71286.1 DUF3800 domain-containing protein [Afipia massiliensis]
MSLAFEKPDIRYVLYVDEAGDPGLARIQPMDANGASEWLSIGAVLVRQERERDTVSWVQEIRQLINATQRPDLHFRGLNAARKALLCDHLAKLPLRCFALLSNKKNMLRHQNERVQAARPFNQEWFYNWCIRLLLERVTDFVEADALKTYGSAKHLQVVFSERGGMRYGQTAAYHDLLKEQARSNSTLLNKRTIKWKVLHPASNRIIAHAKNAGVQLADAVASSFYQGANTLSVSTWDPAFAKMLKPVIPTENGRHADYGVTLLPVWHKAKLTSDQEQLFRFYGYPIK